MRLYKPKNHLSVAGIIILLVGSVLLGVVLGALAYFISNFFYLFLVFPLLVGILAMIPFGLLAKASKIRHSILTAFLGLVTGILLSLTFYSIPYLVFRDRNIKEIQQIYQVGQPLATNYFDTLLKEETGSRGLIGFMKFRANNGEQYSSYVMIGAIAFKIFDFSMSGPLVWILWLLEILFFSLPLSWIGFVQGKTLFNQSANDWYLIKKEMGELSISDKEGFLACVNSNDLDGAARMLALEGSLEHPMLELYEQHSGRNSGDILISLFQTSRKNQKTVARAVLKQWELTETEYSRFKGQSTPSEH